jgi:hypothetical protein
MSFGNSKAFAYIYHSFFSFDFYDGFFYYAKLSYENIFLNRRGVENAG